MIAVRELKTQYISHKIEISKNIKTVDSPEKVAQLFKSLFPDASEEHMISLMLNNKNRLHGYCLVSKGTVSETIIHPREIFKSALLVNASSIILAHNHPSGVVSPSKEDIDVTKRIAEVSKVIGIGFIDHVVVNANTETEDSLFYSMREHGYL
jgi:DNA repair protein RadC